MIFSFQKIRYFKNFQYQKTFNTSAKTRNEKLSIYIGGHSDDMQESELATLENAYDDFAHFFENSLEKYEQLKFNYTSGRQTVEEVDATITRMFLDVAEKRSELIDTAFIALLNTAKKILNTYRPGLFPWVG